MLGKEFPILKRKINGRRLVYLDNASTTQKPESVIRAMDDFYRQHNANIHRGIHTLSVEATNLYEGARDKVKKFINAKHREEIIFTSGATEAINLVVWTWGHDHVKRGDEIMVSDEEHHSNFVPWQILAKKKGARLNNKLTKKTKIVAVAHMGNVLGNINPVEKIIRQAHKIGAKVLIDGAQAGAHLKVDVQKLGADFYVLSGHKMYGPTGVGVLYGRREILEKMPPYQSGGHMIKSVELDPGSSPGHRRKLRLAWADLPHKFEAGTASISEVVGLGAAIDFINAIGIDRIMNYELGIMEYAMVQLQKVPGIIIYGPKKRGPVIAFNIEGVPPHDLASILDEQGIAIRTGHHCAMPLHRKLGIESSARVSFAIYNTKRDVDKLVEGIKYALSVFSPPREGETKRGS